MCWPIPDKLGPLAYFCARRDKAGLGFYMAFRDGLTALLFDELKTGFHGFHAQRRLERNRARHPAGARKAVAYTGQVTAIYAAGREQDLADTRKAIEETLCQRGVKL
jgi:hypothetical protein